MSKKISGPLRRILRDSDYARNFGHRLTQARAAMGLSQADMADLLEWRSDSWSKLERGELVNINIAALGRLCRSLDEKGISLRWLLMGVGRIDERTDLSAAGVEELKEALTQAIARNLVATQLAAVGQTAGQPVEPAYRIVAAEEITGFGWSQHYVPIVGRMTAGDEFVDTSEADAAPPGWADRYVEYAGSPAGAFAVQVVGDSMEPDYHSGDIVLIDPAATAGSGVCCVQFRDEAGVKQTRLKRLSLRGKTATLSSVNRSYKPIKLPAERLVGAWKIMDRLSIGG